MPKQLKLILKEVKMYKIGKIIDARPDGSYIYMSSKGVLNLDDWRDLKEAKEYDNSLIKTPHSSRDSLFFTLPQDCAPYME